MRLSYCEAQVITKDKRFVAAMTGASSVLYRASYGHDQYQLYWEQELGLPWENASGWEAISPFNDVANCTTPTLIVCGEKDWNVSVNRPSFMLRVVAPIRQRFLSELLYC